MLTASIHLHAYLKEHHPQVADEVYSRFQSQPCTTAIVQHINGIATTRNRQPWESRLITIAAVLVMCSPETMYTGCRVRRNVATPTANVIGVSRQYICQEVDRARHYYTHVAWCRDAVDKIVKEVRNNG